MITEELVAYPDDGIDRWLIRGELHWRRWEHRTPDCGSALTNVGFFLERWASEARASRGVALVDAYHRIARSPDTTVGIDVSLISQAQREVARHQPFVKGRPLVAVKLIRPEDRHGEVTDSIREFLNAGVSQVWLVDPDFEVVGVFRPGKNPEYFNRADELFGDPELPGLRARMAELFE